MKDRAIQPVIPYDTNRVEGIKSNAINQSVAEIMRTNHKEHCADLTMDANPFKPVGLSKDGKR